MNVIGDIERAFATSLYPLRVPIAIALTIALIVVLVVASRRGWFAAARRHPGRTTAVAAAVLAIGAPIGWYLGSPLFIRTALQEPTPVVGLPTIEPTASSTASGNPSTGTATPSPLPAGQAPTQAPPRSGSFTGADDFHFGRGTATLLETAPGSWVVRFEDFSVRNGPDLYVYLSPDAQGYAKNAVELGRLKATDGAFNTAVPAGTNVAGLNSVVIWCKQFAVQFAVAPLH